MRKRFGFTIVELLTALVVIAILVGFLIPAMSMVRKIAKETAQKHQLATLDMAIMAFKNDYGDYPPSEWRPAPPPPEDYCGAQKLAEALLGWDLVGFHPDSAWRADGYDGLTPSGPWTYDPDKVRGDNSLHERKGPYLELATTNVFKLDDLFDGSSYTAPLDGQRFVICDVFGVKKVSIGGKMVKAGTPILYYKANTSSKTIDPSVPWNDRIYSAYDNLPLVVELGIMTDNPPRSIVQPYGHPLGWDIENLYNSDHGGDVGENGICGIRDSRILPPAPAWPYRPDSYILISAGADGLYGTSDDIRNF